jgi:hypothetical protein
MPQVENSMCPHVIECNQNTVTAKVLTHSYDPSNLGGGDEEDHSSRPVWGEKNYQDAISTNKLCIVVDTCNLSYTRGIGRRITEGGQSGQKLETLCVK